jgi:hypothetical protein
MEAADHEVHDATLADFDFRRQNVVIGRARQLRGWRESVQAGTKRNGNAKPVIILQISLVCSRDGGSRAEASGYHKAQTNPS